MDNLAELRDRIIANRALQQQAQVNSKKAIGDLKSLIDSLEDEKIEKLLNLGFDVSYLKTIDFERLQEDKEYLESIKSVSTQLYESVYKYLEVQLV